MIEYESAEIPCYIEKVLIPYDKMDNQNTEVKTRLYV